MLLNSLAGRVSSPQSRYRLSSARLLAFALAVATFWLLAPVVPEAHAQTPPAPTTSRYMSTVDPTVHYNEGMAQAAAAEEGGLILDFGQAITVNGVYGTTLFNNAFASVGQIETAAENWLQGYWDGRGPGITLVVGTSNYLGSGGTTTYAHGQAWGSMVNDIMTWISSNSYGSVEAARGGSDMEAGYNTYAATKSWTDGEANYSPSGPPWGYYNYGSCDGCPESQPSCSPSPSCWGSTPIANGWTVDNIYYVSWYSTAALEPVPEIYYSPTQGKCPGGSPPCADNAYEWQTMSLYGHAAYNYGIIFEGSLTQYGASTDNPDTFTPDQGWTWFDDVLNSNPQTAQNLLWSTDITFNN